MQIPEELSKKWETLRSHGDGKKIADQNPGVTTADVSRAINQGECADHIFEAIANFYLEKEKKVQAYLQQTVVEKE